MRPSGSSARHSIDEGAPAEVTNPIFIAFDATPADQALMATRINTRGKTPCYHNNAGIASAFARPAYGKLETDGVPAQIPLIHGGRPVPARLPTA